METNLIITFSSTKSIGSTLLRNDGTHISHTAQNTKRRPRTCHIFLQVRTCSRQLVPLSFLHFRHTNFKPMYKVTFRHGSTDAYKAASRKYNEKIKTAIIFLLILFRTSLSAHKLATGKKLIISKPSKS